MRTRFLTCVTAALCLTIGAAFVQSVHAQDISVGGDGTVWKLGPAYWSGGPPNLSIHRWNGSDWDLIPGGAVRIDVNQEGDAWIVNDAGSIYRYDGSNWVDVAGCAKDIGVGGEGSVWIVDCDSKPNGGRIHRLVGGEWIFKDGEAVRIDVNRWGEAWHVRKNGETYRYHGGSWHYTPGSMADVNLSSVGGSEEFWAVGNDKRTYRNRGAAASWSWEEVGGFANVAIAGNDANRTLGITATGQVAQVWPRVTPDISVGGDGTVWKIGAAGDIARMKSDGTWEVIPGIGTRIDVDPQGNAWHVNSAGHIYKYDSGWARVAGCAKDIGVGGEGSVWIVGCDQKANGWDIRRLVGSTWNTIPGEAVRIDVNRWGEAWHVGKNGETYRYHGGSWHHTPGSMVDVGLSSVGGSEEFWAVGNDKRTYRNRGAAASWSWEEVGDFANVAIAGNDANRTLGITATGQLAQVWPPITPDISVGGDGTVWKIGAAGDIARMRSDGTWEALPGIIGTRIDVDPQGNAWVVDSGKIYRHVAGSWVFVDSCAKDIGIGGEGSVWIVGCDPKANGWGIYRRLADGTWESMPGEAVRIDVNRWGEAWCVGKNGATYRYHGSSWHNTPGSMVDVGLSSVGGSEEFWAVGNDKRTYRNRGAAASWSWEEVGGVASVAIAGDDANTTWGITATGQVEQVWPLPPPPPRRRIAVDPQGNAWIVNQ